MILHVVDITSGGTSGPSLDEALAELDNNMHGSVVGDVMPEEIARMFLAAGWSARKSSWTEYEVRHRFAEIEFYRDQHGVTGFHGVVDPERLTALADQFTSLGLACSIELYGPDGQTLLRELQVDGRDAAHQE